MGCRAETWNGNTEFLEHKVTTTTSMSVVEHPLYHHCLFFEYSISEHIISENPLNWHFYKGRKRGSLSRNQQASCKPMTVLSKQTHDFASKASVQSHGGTLSPWKSELTHFRGLKSSVVEYGIFGVIHGTAVTSEGDRSQITAFP